MTAMLAKRPKVAVLGPKGTFSDEAAHEKFGTDAEYLYEKQLTGIFEKVENREADFGFVPTEDSEEGDVLDSLNLLKDYPLYIVGEAEHEVEHSLLSKGTKAQVATIGSHSQVLRHCRKYLYTHFPNATLDTTLSTVDAAKKAQKDPTYAAIASEGNARRMGLNILEREIHDKGNNTTRFLIMSPEEATFSLRSPAKTSLLFHTKKEEPGILTKILNVFAEKGINLKRIVSRPEGGYLGNYMFFIDIIGRNDDAQIKSTIDEATSLDSVSHVRNFGSYPTTTHSERKKEKSSPLELLKSTFSFWDNEEDKAYDTL